MLSSLLLKQLFSYSGVTCFNDVVDIGGVRCMTYGRTYQQIVCNCYCIRL